MLCCLWNSLTRWVRLFQEHYCQETPLNWSILKNNPQKDKVRRKKEKGEGGEGGREEKKKTPQQNKKKPQPKQTSQTPKNPNLKPSPTLLWLLGTAQLRLLSIFPQLFLYSIDRSLILQSQHERCFTLKCLRGDCNQGLAWRWSTTT